jgi:hypothetical protein
MSFAHAAPPPEGEDIIARTLYSRAGGGDPSLQPGILRPQSLLVSTPHPAYFCGASDVAAGRLLTAAVRTGWRYLLFDGSVPVAAAELHEAEGGELEFSNLETGDSIGLFVAALERAAPMDDTRAAYEIRLLRVPALFFSALWLAGEDHLLIPLVALHGLAAFETHGESEVLKGLQPAAQRLLTFDQTVTEI